MPRIVKRTVVYAVGAGLFTASWILLGVLALGDRLAEKIPRNDADGGYV